MYSGRKADHLIEKFTNSEHKCCFHTSFNILYSLFNFSTMWINGNETGGFL